MEIWQNLEKNTTQIMIILPHLCGRKIKNSIPFQIKQEEKHIIQPCW